MVKHHCAFTPTTTHILTHAFFMHTFPVYHCQVDRHNTCGLRQVDVWFTDMERVFPTLKPLCTHWFGWTQARPRALPPPHHAHSHLPRVYLGALHTHTSATHTTHLAQLRHLLTFSCPLAPASHLPMAILAPHLLPTFPHTPLPHTTPHHTHTHTAYTPHLTDAARGAARKARLRMRMPRFALLAHTAIAALLLL